MFTTTTDHALSIVALFVLTIGCVYSIPRWRRERAARGPACLADDVALLIACGLAELVAAVLRAAVATAPSAWRDR